MPGSSAAAHAFKIAKRTPFRKHLPGTYALDAVADSEVRIVRFPDFNHEAYTRDLAKGDATSLRSLATSSARGSVQLSGFRDIGTAAHVVDIPFRSSSITKSESIVGVKSNRLVVISEGSFVVAFTQISVTPVLEREGAFGIESDCLAKIGDSFFIIAFVRIYDASVPKGMSILGLESDRF